MVALANKLCKSNLFDPQRQTDFGANENPNLAIPFTQSEEDFTNAAFPVNGSRTVVWPSSSFCVPVEAGSS